MMSRFAISSSSSELKVENKKIKEDLLEHNNGADDDGNSNSTIVSVRLLSTTNPAPVLDLRSPTHLMSGLRDGDGSCFDKDEQPVVQLQCDICMSLFLDTEFYTLMRCRHSFCFSCLQMHIQESIKQNKIPSKCPLLDCEQDIDEDDVKGFMENPALIERYHKLLILKTNPNARLCPRCDHLQIFSEDELPLVVCGRCNIEFCFFHSLAHVGSSCAEYDARAPAPEEKQSLALIKTLSKPCPGCKMPVELSGGCSHVTCPYCSTEYCWDCGNANLSGGKFLKTCPVCEKTYVVHRYLPLWLALWILLLPLWIIYSVLACALCPLCTLPVLDKSSSAGSFCLEMSKLVFLPFYACGDAWIQTTGLCSCCTCCLLNPEDFSRQQ